MSEIKKIAFAGSGNVATHLAKAMYEAGIEIVGFYSRKASSAQILAEKYQVKWGLLSELKVCHADLIIVSVPDHAIQEVLTLLPSCKSLLVHTSGSLEMNALKSKSHRIGVFYPLQTFSREKPLDFSQIPIMVEAAELKDTKELLLLAEKISSKVFEINSAKRMKIHIAAVFSSNFTNYLFHIAADLLEREQIPFEVIQPLIEETTEKIKHLHPSDAQTGPAMRNDQDTISLHLEDLESIPEYHEIYKLLSHHIFKSRKN